MPELRTGKLVVIGHPARSALAKVPAGWGGEAFDLGGPNRPVEEILRTVVEQIDREASLVAIGDIHGGRRRGARVPFRWPAVRRCPDEDGVGRRAVSGVQRGRRGRRGRP